LSKLGDIQESELRVTSASRRFWGLSRITLRSIGRWWSWERRWTSRRLGISRAISSPSQSSRRSLLRKTLKKRRKLC